MMSATKRMLEEESSFGELNCQNTEISKKERLKINPIDPGSLGVLGPMPVVPPRMAIPRLGCSRTAGE